MTLTVAPARLMVGDALRALAAASVVVAAWQWGPVGAALFLLVLGGTLVPRAIGAPTALDVAYCAVLLLAAYAAQLDWYVAIGWLDVAVHAVATALIAVVTCLALARWGGLDRDVLGGWLSGIAVASTGAALAVLWELGEWFGHTWLDDRIQVGYTDTIGDLAAGFAGSVVAGVVVARSARR
ncbi:hypothetical protein [Cellulomonas sp. PhB150]|uniref:hypothetical protein n=1 Tax=Cellulomonas sp. PhB150 TaxID=2485188 RepID=UPI000F487337|nr:hypothetical protein [Cellulomonas sp. PhB150]ROS26055.1 hypothetical protein EDF34_2384 [Cellulomonas sp. PhB150]